MKSLVYFVPVRESFTFLSIRQNLIRIPEILIRLREAEHVVNEFHSQFQGTVDLISIMQSNWTEATLNLQKTGNDTPLVITEGSPSAGILRKKLSLIVSYASQVGLFDRYLKSSSYPEFIMHNSDSYSATLVSLKHCSMKQAIQNILEEDLPEEKIAALSSYVIFKRVVDQYEEYEKIEIVNFKARFEQFTLTESLKAFVHLGPGQSSHINFSDLSSSQFTELESIFMDPVLNWFWSDIRLPVFATEPSIAI